MSEKHKPDVSPYISERGRDRLLAEQTELWRRRRDVVAALSAAAAEGDRSENAEYIYRKKELAGLDRRIRYLQRRLPILKVVPAIVAAEQVRFGARVQLATATGELTATLLGADEIDPSKRRISIDSPMARALLGRRVGDAVDVRVEDRTMTYRIKAIDYPALDPQD